MAEIGIAIVVRRAEPGGSEDLNFLARSLWVQDDLDHDRSARETFPCLPDELRRSVSSIASNPLRFLAEPFDEPASLPCLKEFEGVILSVHGENDMPPNVSFKSTRIESEFKMGMSTMFPFSLREIVGKAIDMLSGEGKDVVLTSIFRTWPEDAKLKGTGIHCLWRAVDIGAESWTDPNVQSVADALNSEWVYDPTRPGKLVALYQEHGTGPHLHLQVCGNTERRDESK